MGEIVFFVVVGMIVFVACLWIGAEIVDNKGKGKGPSKKAQSEEEKDEAWEKSVSKRCILDGKSPSCPYARLVAAWALAADSAKEAAKAWDRVL